MPFRCRTMRLFHHSTGVVQRRLRLLLLLQLQQLLLLEPAARTFFQFCGNPPAAINAFFRVFPENSFPALVAYAAAAPILADSPDATAESTAPLSPAPENLLSSYLATLHAPGLPGSQKRAVHAHSTLELGNQQVAGSGGRAPDDPFYISGHFSYWACRISLAHKWCGPERDQETGIKDLYCRVGECCNHNDDGTYQCRSYCGNPVEKYHGGQCNCWNCKRNVSYCMASQLDYGGVACYCFLGRKGDYLRGRCVRDACDDNPCGKPNLVESCAPTSNDNAIPACTCKHKYEYSTETYQCEESKDTCVIYEPCGPSEAVESCQAVEDDFACVCRSGYEFDAETERCVRVCTQAENALCGLPPGLPPPHCVIQSDDSTRSSAELIKCTCPTGWNQNPNKRTCDAIDYCAGFPCGNPTNIESCFSDNANQRHVCTCRPGFAVDSMTGQCLSVCPRGYLFETLTGTCVVDDFCWESACGTADHVASCQTNKTLEKRVCTCKPNSAFLVVENKCAYDYRCASLNCAIINLAYCRVSSGLPGAPQMGGDAVCACLVSTHVVAADDSGNQGCVPDACAAPYACGADQDLIIKCENRLGGQFCKCKDYAHVADEKGVPVCKMGPNGMYTPRGTVYVHVDSMPEELSVTMEPCASLVLHRGQARATFRTMQETGTPDERVLTLDPAAAVPKGAGYYGPIFGGMDFLFSPQKGTASATLYFIGGTISNSQDKSLLHQYAKLCVSEACRTARDNFPAKREAFRNHLSSIENDEQVQLQNSDYLYDAYLSLSSGGGEQACKIANVKVESSDDSVVKNLQIVFRKLNDQQEDG